MWYLTISVFFCSLIRRPPLSTLTVPRVPYTTRSRSYPPPRHADSDGAWGARRHRGDRVGGVRARDADPSRAGRERYAGAACLGEPGGARSEEHTSDLQSLMRISYAVFCLKQQKQTPPTLFFQKKNTQNY